MHAAPHKDMDGLKERSVLSVFVCHGSLCFCVGVRVHVCMGGVSKTVSRKLAVGIERLASNGAETAVMYISFQGQ